MSGDAGGRPIRFVSWNVHGAVGGDRACDPERVMAAIRRLDPDILALQEIDGRTHLKRLPMAFEFFAGALGDHRCEARLFGKPERECGQILWSRWPFAALPRVHLLGGGGFEPRAAIEAMIETPAGRLSVVAAHLGLSPLARRVQAAVLAGLVAPEVPTLVAGDLNEWRPGGPVHRRLAARLPMHARPRTWPARLPLVPLDRFYASADVRILDVQVDAGAAAASDHLPLVVEFSIIGRSQAR